MSTGNTTEEYCNLLGQHVSAFSTVSHREGLPLSHMIRLLSQGGQRGQECRIFKVMFQVLFLSKQAYQHRFYALFMLSRVFFHSCNHYRKTSFVIGTGKTGWVEEDKKTKWTVLTALSSSVWGIPVIPRWKICLWGSDLWY